MDSKAEEAGCLDPDIKDEGPSAPPADLLGPVSGYEGTPTDWGGEGNLYPPPPDRANKPEIDRNAAVPHVRVPTVSEDVAREALVQYAGSKWTWSRKPARELVFEELKPFTIYRYRLETYTESRATAWSFEPFTGQLVDGPQYGIPPLPWDVAVEVPPMYKDIEEKVKVPHTSSVKECHTCYGRGKVRCSHCNGWGKVRCSSCFGSGHSQGKRCTWCHGAGRRRCTWCGGSGHKTCNVCKGHCNLLHYILLTVTWKNQIYEHVPNRCPDFPIKLFEKVSGDKFFVDENVLVYPIVGFPDEEICEASKKGNQEHLAKFSKMRILQQRQTIELVPLTQAFYKYKDQQYNYYVYGTENQVHATKYPTNCTLL
ncbi:LOW QUALITY PROTEIN: protein SSUH2 homolog [Erpetoichthys calabaricus]|uniref:LOW QUALITY PROTEIN: protein SSUH2 homolog n=1 Tax=Erpetoichthys calabaricus TaxID=27687 RepID=UPI0022344479|nr:LOW QUALITY PROTEIN: protein SSUH2 homolog [Erpetoichthys calabaricus]